MRPMRKVNGAWHYVYRAIDQNGQVIDVLACARREAKSRVAVALTELSISMAIGSDPAQLQRIRRTLNASAPFRPSRISPAARLSTAAIENISALRAVVREGGELKRDGSCCGREVECVTNAHTPWKLTAATRKPTIRFAEGYRPRS